MSTDEKQQGSGGQIKLTVGDRSQSLPIEQVETWLEAQGQNSKCYEYFENGPESEQMLEVHNGILGLIRSVLPEASAQSNANFEKTQAAAKS